MKLTPAQNTYLLKALELQKGHAYGIYFSLWIPGPRSTGKALLRRKLIRSAHEGMKCTADWPFVLSETGMEIALELWRNRAPEVRT